MKPEAEKEKDPTEDLDFLKIFDRNPLEELVTELRRLVAKNSMEILSLKAQVKMLQEEHFGLKTAGLHHADNHETTQPLLRGPEYPALVQHQQSGEPGSSA